MAEKKTTKTVKTLKKQEAQAKLSLVEANGVIAARVYHLSDVISKEEFKAKRFGWDNYNGEVIEHTFKLDGYPNVTYYQDKGSRTFVLWEGIEKREINCYRNKYRDYADFIRFLLYPSVNFEVTFEELSFDEQVKEIRNKVVGVSKSYLEVAFLLSVVKKNRCDSTDTLYFNGQWLKFYAFAEASFGLGKTTVKNMLSIVDKFCSMSEMQLLPDYKFYSYSQLSELVPVEPKLIKDNFNSTMTVKEIRDKKKELIGSGTSVKENNGVLKGSETKPTVIKTFDDFHCKEKELIKNLTIPETDEDFKKLLMDFCDELFVGWKFYSESGYRCNKVPEFKIITALLSFAHDIGVMLEGCVKDIEDFNGFGNIDFAVRTLRSLGYIEDNE